MKLELHLKKSKMFQKNKEGEYVIRMLAGRIPMGLKITELTPDKIICGAWEFKRDTGVEIDEDIPVIVSFLARTVNDEIFKHFTKSDPSDDDVERCNCTKAGSVGHFSCGWCASCCRPVFICGHRKESSK